MGLSGVRVGRAFCVLALDVALVGKVVRWAFRVFVLNVPVVIHSQRNGQPIADPNLVLILNVVVCQQTATAVGSSTDITTSSTSYVEMTDLSVTLTTTGGDLIVWFGAPYGQNGAAIIDITFAFQLDAGAEVQEKRLHTYQSTSHMRDVTLMWRFTGVSAASHTVKVRWKVGSNSGHIAGDTNRTLMMMEVDA